MLPQFVQLVLRWPEVLAEDLPHQTHTIRLCSSGRKIGWREAGLRPAPTNSPEKPAAGPGVQQFRI
jgi:hypothetical protein